MYALKRRFTWQRQAKSVIATIGQADCSKLIDEGKKTLIIVPHSDDEWIGCSQVIRTWKNVVICDADMPGGDSPVEHEIRKMELEATCKIYNREYIHASIDSLVETIRKQNPEVLFIPYYVDWHDEHLAVLKNIFDNAEQLDKRIEVISYQVSVPILERFINKAVPMTRLLHREKWKHFKKYYKSQTVIPFQRFAINERIQGELINQYAAEVFRTLDLGAWLREYEKYQLTIEEQRELISNLSNLSSIRQTVDRILSEKE